MEVNRLYLKRLIRHLEIRVLAHLLLVFVIYFSHRLHYLLQIRLSLCESVKVVHDLSQFFILQNQVAGNACELQSIHPVLISRIRYPMTALFQFQSL